MFSGSDCSALKVVYKPSAVNPDLCVPKERSLQPIVRVRFATMIRQLLETQHVHAVSARFEAWMAPTRTWRALAVFVCFSARLLHFVPGVSCHAQI